MATLKVACSKCGQKVSGDESFYGSTVSCPVCTAEIHFPGRKPDGAKQARATGGQLPTASAGQLPHPPEGSPDAVSAEPGPGLPDSAVDEAPPQAAAGASAEMPLPLPSRDAPTSSPGDGPSVPSPLFAAMSLVSAILGVVTCLGGILFAPLAIIFGHTALARGRHSPVQPPPGQTLAVVGLVVGYVSLALTILVLAALVLFGDSIPTPEWLSLQPDS